MPKFLLGRFSFSQASRVRSDNYDVSEQARAADVYRVRDTANVAPCNLTARLSAGDSGHAFDSYTP
jgi:hypothetical protein